MNTQEDNHISASVPLLHSGIEMYPRRGIAGFFISHWRDVFFVIFIIAGGLLAAGYYVNASLSAALSGAGGKLTALKETSVRLANQAGLREIEGGDIPVPPAVRLDPQLKEGAGAPPEIEAMTAQTVLVKDKRSGAVLFSKNEYEPHPMASITKLMTALVLLDYAPDFSATTTASGDAVFDTVIAQGETYRMADLWSAALVGSSNSAVLSLADALEPDREEFVRRMNAKARELGMSAAVFTEPTGLDSGNAATGSDIALLLAEALRHPDIADTLVQADFNLTTAAGAYPRHIWNTDWLLLGWIPHSFSHFSGGKTGYIPESGYNFTMEVANGGGRGIQVVILGAETHESRFTEARDLAQWVFENYIWP